MTWELNGDGGHTITKYLLQYRKFANDSELEWKTIDDIQPNASSVTV